ncbi:unnamed protein product, partial [Linum tenue]
PVQPPPPSATIPVVDLGRPPHAVASAVRKASDEWGVFQVTNHGIPTTLLREAEFEARRLFALPAEEKLAVVRSPDGIDGYGLARISRFFCQANVVRRVYDHGFACKACESPLAERLRQFLQRYGRVPSPNEGPIREAPRHNVQVIGPSPRRHQVAPLQNQSPPTTGRPPTQLLPGLPRPGPRYGPGPAHGLIPHHSPPPEQQRHRPPNLRRRRQPLDPGEPDPRRAHRQRRRPDAHRHQRAVQDRPASSGREQDTSSRLHGLLLRHATGGEDIATNEAGRRGPSTALPACDVERVP